MNEIEAYIAECVKIHVWGGFALLDEVYDVIWDLMEPGADEEALRRFAEAEFKRKREAEEHWPDETDVDRLDQVFSALEKMGVLGLHYAGYTMSDGHTSAAEELALYPSNPFVGYCFYHGQDMERAIEGKGLMLAFDHVQGDVPEKKEVG